MRRTCIALVDATRARLFLHERSLEPDGLHDTLVEQRDLVNLARHEAPHELFASSGTIGGRTGNRGYGFDDHRDAHVVEMDSVFARDTIAEIDKLVRASGSARLVLCASPRMLGVLRGLGNALRRDGLSIDEYARDLVKLTTLELREQLATYGVLPRSEGLSQRSIGGAR